MTELEVQLVSNEDGEATAVIVPIALWREIQSERETAYLLKSPAMKRRLLEAKQRDSGQDRSQETGVRSQNELDR